MLAVSLARMVATQLRDEAGGLGAVKGGRIENVDLFCFSGSSGGSDLAFRMTSKTCKKQKASFL